MKTTKKFLALFLSVLMVFSMLSTSAFAITGSAPNTEGSEIVEPDINVDTTIDIMDPFDIARYLIDSIHDLVGYIMSIVGKECPFCDQIHSYQTEEPEEDPDGNALSVIPSFGGKVNNVSGFYKEGDVIALEATPDEGWEFAGWEATNGGTFEDAAAAATNFTMPDALTTVVAKFSKAGDAELTDDEYFVYRAYYATEIIYSDGDYEDSVTQKLTLPTTYEEEGNVVDIEWKSSDEDSVDSEGNVFRGSEDKNVVLTAVFTKGEAVYEKDFSITVIKESEISEDEIDDNLVTDLEEMNKEAEYELEIYYNEDNTQVVFISGKYSDIVVDSVESALLSVYSVKSMIGLDDPNSQLAWAATNNDGATLSYTFQQKYNGIPVYGASVTLNADIETGETLSLSANVLDADLLSAVDCDAALTESDIAAMFEADGPIEKCEKFIIKSADAYVLAYVLTTNDEVIIVDADNGNIITRYSTVTSFININTNGKGKTEEDVMVEFPVLFSHWDFEYSQEDVVRNIDLNGGNNSEITKRYNTEWEDKTANSAYTNIIKAYDFFYNNFNRRSVDNRGKKIKVNVHQEICEDRDNAHSHGSSGEFCFFDNSDSAFATTTANGFDIATHEYTHNVFANIINTDFPYENETGSINEAYADIFACFADGDWMVGEDWSVYPDGLRNIADPESMGYPANMSSPSYYTGEDQSYLVHTNTTVVSHAAYLMSTYGITGSKLVNLWYNSMSQGYSASSTFKTVRRNVIQAAKNLHFSDEELANVRKAFDTVGIYDERCDLAINLIDNFNNAINVNEDVISISLQRDGVEVPETSYDIVASGNPANINAYFGKYTLTVTADGYLPYTGTIELAKNSHKTITVKLVKEGVTTVYGTVTNATTGYALEGATYTLVEGINMTSGTPICQGVTDASGWYGFEIPAGYYTLIVSKEDYVTGYFNISANGGEEIVNNVSISPVIAGNSFRVVLTWNADPSDLDSHLFGYPGNGYDYHVYYSNKDAYDEDYNNVANLDVDDTTGYGPETTTFTVDASGKYEYYIDWYTGSGTWASCGGHIEVYNENGLIATFDAPTVDNKSGSWKVFTIENGIFTAHNIIQSVDVYDPYY